LELDLWEGSAWIGLVPFVVEGLTLPRAPSVPWLSTFPETNVRTYVIDPHGLRGIWFFSLDAARLLAVIGARTAYALPYFWSRMRVRREGDSVHYMSNRLQGPRAGSDIRVRILETVSKPSELELFLTARFRLYAERGGKLLKADVEHPPWPLQRAGVTGLQQDLLQAAHLPAPGQEPITHFAAGVDVLVGPPQRV
jgi:uncharacterized protein YqjF (DUF2071 family)